MNHIELFAGCGGLSLGLESAGFELVLANELSPMAAESFAYNFLDEDVEAISNTTNKPARVLWLNSKFEQLKPRLRENPFEFPSVDQEGFSDVLGKPIAQLEGKLIVGSVVELNKALFNDVELVEALRTAFGAEGGLDLVSGGPPCQSFSMAGLRERHNEKNTLPLEFARFVAFTQPKLVMLENVTGILRPFKDDNGDSYHAWYEVAKAFASINYVPVCLHVNAKFAGVAQNRPRFIMIGIRFDHYEYIINVLNYPQDVLTGIFEPSVRFYHRVQSEGTNLEFGHLAYLDATNPEHLHLFTQSFLSELVNEEEVSVADALDDLKQHYPSAQSPFINQLNNTFDLPDRNYLHNHEFRNNGELVKRRFRLYQVLSKVGGRKITQDIFSILKGQSKSLTQETWEACRSFEFLQLNGELEQFNSKNEFELYLLQHPTKKQTQKALIANQPAPAALSIPDDACHYDENELRVLTVREMARIQSFPDNFVFRSKVTTGGQMRKFEVPQYTQVGNAVPPLLARKLGLCLAELLP